MPIVFSNSFVFFLFMIFRFECLSNCWMMVIASEYIIPKESNICQFEVNQMNAGSGDWWVYGQDKTNYYFFLAMILYLILHIQ